MPNLLHPAGPAQQLLALTYMKDISHPKEHEGLTSQVGGQQNDGLDMPKEEAASGIGIKVESLGGEPREKEKAPKPIQGASDKFKVKTTNCQPPEGKRRCGHNCVGCSKRCVDKGLDNCQNCLVKINIYLDHFLIYFEMYIFGVGL